MATYPDGTLLQASGPEIDRMEGGQRRWIPDPPTFTCMGLSLSAVRTIADSEWNQIPKGAAYPSRADGTLLQGSGPQVYVMTACQRHLIPDPATFNAHGYIWSAIQKVSDTDLTAIPEGAPLVHSYPDGTLLKASGPEIDRMQGGQRRWIPDPPTFTCMGLNWGAIQTISDSEWNQIPQGGMYPSRADGTLLQGTSAPVYVMSGCQRHWIPDPDTFNDRGYNWNAVHHHSDADLAAIPEGAPLPSVRPQLLDNNCGSSPAIDGSYVYFQGGPLRNALYRRPKDGSGGPQVLDDNCGSSPVIDGNYVYFQGGPGRNALYRRPKDGSGGAQVLDNNCGSSPEIGGNYVYFQGGPLRNALYRRAKDGSGGAELKDDNCGGSPVCDSTYIYFLGGPLRNALYRCLQDRLDAAQLVDDTCGSSPAIDGDYVYFQGGPGRNALYRVSPRTFPRLGQWMTVNASVIKNLPLWQIALPGSHDSGTYGDFKVKVAAPWTRAQGLSIGYQLAYGIRYFDLRFEALGDGSYAVEHGGYTCNVTLEAVLHDIKTFLEYPESAGEILILDLRWAVPSLDVEKLLVSKVCDACGLERIITKQTIGAINDKTGSTKQFPAHCTPGELWDAGKKQVIILWAGQAGIIQWKQDHDDDPRSDARYIWAGDYFQISREGNFGTAYTWAELKGGRTRDLTWWKENCKTTQDKNQTRYWWRLGVHATPGAENAYTSLFKAAEETLPVVLDELGGGWKKEPWNIVSADLFDTQQYVAFAQAVIQLNGQYQY